MSPRKKENSRIIEIQTRIDYYSQQYITTGLFSYRMQYESLIKELIDIKLAIKEWERINGWED